MNRPFAAVSLCAALWLHGCSANPQSADPLAAKVNGVEIHASVLQKELQSRFGPEVLKDLVNSEVIRQEATRQAVEISQPELEKRLAEMKDNPQVKAMMAAGQVTQEDLRRNLTTLMHLDGLIAKSIKEQDEKDYLVQHREELETARVQSILLPDPESAAKILAQARQPGTDFGKLAKEHSLDPQGKDTGGDLGDLRRDQMDSAVAQEIFALKVGQISSVVQTPLGFYIFKLLDHKFEFKDLKKVVHERLAEEKRTEILEVLRAKAKIEVKAPYSLPPEGHAADVHAGPEPTASATPLPATPAASPTAAPMD